jgi:3-(3-hydroxy-phenyl)propionate hydroxylase
MRQVDSKVIVVGAGPAGYASALGLAELGVPCTLLEQDVGVAAGSRATGISRRALQLLAPSGVAEDVMSLACVQRANQAFFGSTELFIDRTPPEPGKYPRIVNLQQDLFERMLLAAVEQRPAIDVRWAHRVDRVTPGRDGVDVEVTAPDGPLRLRAEWLVACDGARSSIRRALRLALRGVRYDTRFLITDVHVPLDLEPGVRRIWFDPPSNPGGTIIMHQQPHDVWRVDFGIPADEAVDAALAPAAIRARVAAHLELLGVYGGWEIVWSGDYTASSVSLDSFRDGRVLFAGDAAHLLPIFGGRGLNSAIEDGFNLAWKLAAVTRGAAHDLLLDSYSTERAEGARQNSAKAVIGAEVIAAHSPGSRLLRGAALGLMLGPEPTLKSLLDHRTADANVYPSALLDLDAPPGAAAHPAERVLPDARVRLADGRTCYLSDALGAGFTVVHVCEDAAGLAAAPSPNGRPATIMGLALGHLRVTRAAELGDAPPAALAPGSYLVRPDHYVMARRAPHEIDEVIAAAARLARPPATDEVQP